MHTKFLKYWFPVILYSGIIFYASGLTNIQVPLSMPFTDKFFHAAEYALLGYLFSRAMFQTTGMEKKQVFVWTVLFCVAYGVSDEIHQYFVPGRLACISDGVADTIGGMLGSVIYKR